VLDTETTGLHPARGDRICEIAVIMADEQWRELEIFATLINPQREISPEARQVNHIAQAELESAPLFSSLAGEIRKLTENDLLVGHNLRFDLDFLRNEFSLLGQEFNPPAAIDTRDIARALFNAPSYGLSALAKLVGLECGPRHRALIDCRITFELFKYLMEAFREQNLTIGDVAQRFALGADYAEGPTVKQLKQALVEKRPVEIEYQDRQSAITIRTIIPHRFFQERGRGYLEAFCQSRQALRTFMLDRIKKVNFL